MLAFSNLANPIYVKMYLWSSLPKDMDSYCANRYRSPYGYGRAMNVYSAAPPHPKSQRQCAGLSNSLVENNANKNVCKQVEENIRQ